MTEFIDIIFSLPTAVFTWPLMLVVLYWGVALAGLFNLEWFDGADAALDGAAGAVDGAIDGAVDGVAANGHEEIRNFYTANFDAEPHSIKILESGVRKGLVYLTISYIFEDGYERCCSYSEYFVKDGKIDYLKVKMTNRAYRTTKKNPE